ncbi:MAG TPA: lipopolysaccharide heptosyltransferase II [Candidatus Sulfotelmatobacter sp.]|nr:lipopolysaccharide heptosyltransferase II [Candidatus Sulfotelmatobacter sp.]
MGDAGRLLVRIPNWLGDAIMARPMLSAIRRHFTGARVVAVGPAALLELLEGDGHWDESAPRDVDPRSTPALGAPADLAIVCPPSFSSAWRAWRLGCRRRVGFRGEARDWLLTDPIARPSRGSLHLSEEYLLLSARVGASAFETPPLRAPALETGSGAPPGSAENDHAPFAILAPGATYGPAKRWPAERFVAVGRALTARGLAVRVCGVGAEREICESVASAIAAARSLAGLTSLQQLARLCSGARLVVANDSGLAHLAAAVGAPTVVVFGSTSSAWTAPLGPKVRVVQRPPVCSPCFQRACTIGYRCLEAVPVRDVLGAAEELAA